MGDEVAHEAILEAPKDTGRGAATIHAQFARSDPLGLHVRVSWDKGVFLGLVHEGTEDIRPNPFLVRALDRVRNRSA